MSRCRIGIDIGGTFTDVTLLDEASGFYHRVKVSSTPSDPSVGALEGVRRVLREASFQPDDVQYFCHGTTVATNAILEGKLAGTALITTAGFRDVLEIGRQRRPNPYDFQAEKPPSLVPRHLRFEVRERVGSSGEVLHPLVEADVRAAVGALKHHPIRSIAVCLLFSFLNPRHEQRIAEIIAEEWPELPVFLSSEILPEYREYERTSTVALSAAVAPVVSRYVQKLGHSIRSVGVASELHLMKSTGGLMTFNAVQRRAVETVLSGPAAGAIAVSYLGGLAGHDRLIGFDMGGTSTDVSLILDGQPRVTSEGRIGHHPLRVPMIDIRTIGAGGGSIAWLDIAGALHVGPASAGADPGPACYGHQDVSPTVTDANLCLGRLDPGYFLGGSVVLDREASERSVRTAVGEPLGWSSARAAHGIVDIVNSNMARAIREISVANGYDVREFGLVSFGGAGGLHACSLAEELDVPFVLMPEDAGLLSARGLLVADVKTEYSITRLSKVNETDPATLVATFQALEGQAVQELEREGIQADTCTFTRSADLRYLGQAYEINVPAPGSGRDVMAWDAAFHRLHEQMYWWSASERPTEFVNLRVVATAPVPKIRPRREARDGCDPSAALKGRRAVHFARGADALDTPVYERTRLRSGNEVVGPAIVESFDTTILVNPGYRGSMDPLRSLLIRAEGKTIP